MYKFSAGLLLTFVSLVTSATQWEVKQNFRYRDSHQTSEILFKDSGKFDKKKVKQGNRWRLESLITATNETSIDKLDWIWRLGYKYERKDDVSLQYKQDGRLKKDKSRIEYERTKLMGLGLTYKQLGILGADRWVVKAYFDSYLDIDYRAAHVAQDATGYQASSTGWESKVKFSGEYSLGPMGWYVTPMVTYRERYLSGWQDKRSDKSVASAKEQRVELGLWANWLMPIDGVEVFFGPLWQRENEATKQQDDSWQWQRQQRLYAYVMFEYEAPTHGFEMEFKIQHGLSGANRYDTKYKIELSYEF